MEIEMGEENKSLDQMRHIYVAYVGVGEADEKGQKEILKAAYDALFDVLGKHNSETIFIPVRSLESRIECINPEYITDEDLIRKHRLLTDELHEHLDAHIDNLINKDSK